MKKEDYPVWRYKSEDITEMPIGVVGFVYRIVFKEQDIYGNNFQYVGKKLVSGSTRKLPPLKNGKKRANHIKYSYKNKNGKRVPHELVTNSTGWKDYLGSADVIKRESLTPEFREILYFCPSKKSMSYYELKAMMEWEVLEDDTFLNANISGTLFRKDTELFHPKNINKRRI